MIHLSRTKMMTFSVVSTILLSVALPGLAHQKTAPSLTSHKEQNKMAAADYETWKIRGWTVHLEKSIQDHPRSKVALALLDHKLAVIEKLISPEILPELKATPIWLNKDIRMGACYHPDVNWLKANGRMLEKARSVELQSVDSLIDWSVPQPMMILHELAHAYHHRVFQFNHPLITKAFKQAVASKSYEKIKHISGETRRHYALNNEKEYFSECTEAYFGKNDYFPFTRAELKSHDPVGYAMIESVWKVKVDKTEKETR